jgi:hypothetical protein
LYEFTNEKGEIVTQTPKQCLKTKKDRILFDQFLNQIIKDVENVLLRDFPSDITLQFDISTEKSFIDIKILNLEKDQSSSLSFLKRYLENVMLKNTFTFETRSCKYMVWFDLSFNYVI